MSKAEVIEKAKNAGWITREGFDQEIEDIINTAYGDIGVDAAMLEKAKLALRITTDAFDAEIADLLAAAVLDLGVAGVVVPAEIDALVTRACITYVRLHFGQPDDYDRLKRSYDEQKAQLSTCTGYTDWGRADG